MTASVVANSWREAEIGELNAAVTSGSRGWGKYYSEAGDLFVRITNLSRENINLDLSSSKFVRLPDDEREGLRTSVQNGDVLISITADIGIAGIVDDGVPKPAYINQHIASVRFPVGTADGRFVAYYLASEGPQKSFRAMTDTGAKAGMSLGTVRKIKFQCPPLAEQQRIASALKDIDDLIASLDALIAKKHDIKQAAMQQLLTGKTRLPGFDDEWVSIRFSKFAPLQRGFDLPTRQLKSGQYPVAYSNGVLTHHNQFMVKGPGVVTGRSGTIGTITYVEDHFWPHNTSLWVTSFENSHPMFVYYYLQHMNLARFATGSGVPTLNRNDVHAQLVEVPESKVEQALIAETLSDLDEDIAALGAKFEKARTLREGMMQQLLTGRIRLV